MEKKFTLKRNKKAKDYSDIGLEIHAMCVLIEYLEENFNQNKLIGYVNQLVDDGHISSFDFSLNKSSLANLKNKEIDKNNTLKANKVAEILRKTLSFRAIKYISYKVLNDDEILVEYSRSNQNKINFNDPQKIKNKVFKDEGLVDIIDSEPSDSLKEILLKTTEFRILQSCLYGWESDWEEIIKNGIEKGKLRKIKFLLAQPFSYTAQIRAHTINKGHKKPLIAFNQRIQSIIDQIINFSKKYTDGYSKECEKNRLRI